MRSSVRIFVCICILACIVDLLANEIKLPSNPLNGRIVFEEKGCIACHSISGFGGDAGPDLGRDHYYGSVLELGTKIWNHIPEMNRNFRTEKIERPNFSEKEMHDLIGFIFYLRYLGEPGSVANGAKLFKSKECISCHKVVNEGGDTGPDFAAVLKNTSPLFIVQSMWNHGPAMQAKMKEMYLDFPTLEGHDIVDLAAYIHQAAGDKQAAGISPGNPEKGRTVFKAKKCQMCHSRGDNSLGIGPDLSKVNLNKSVTEIAGIMWNHSPQMLEYVKREKMNWPKFTQTTEMADLIAYLYFLSFEDEPGNPNNGNLVFVDKGCSGCHEKEGKGIAPDLAEIPHFISPIRMLQLMWNHSPEMEEVILIRNEEWPELTTIEMRDLYAYIKEITQKN